MAKSHVNEHQRDLGSLSVGLFYALVTILLKTYLCIDSHTPLPVCIYLCTPLPVSYMVHYVVMYFDNLTGCSGLYF